MANKLMPLIVPAVLPYLESLSQFLSANKNNIVNFVNGIGAFITEIIAVVIRGAVNNFIGFVNSVIRGINYVIGLINN